jgi:hypothetical protein
MKGKDDDKYQQLMEFHKRVRKSPNNQGASQAALRAALDLAEKGDVSDKVIMAMQYLG